MERNQFIQYRQQAINWLNSNRDFNTGIDLLMQSGFKPGVIAKLKRDGVNGPEATKRLKFLVQELIKAWAMNADDLKDTSVDDGIVDGKNIHIQSNHTDQKSLGIIAASVAIQNNKTIFPAAIDTLIKLYADYYKRRDILHKQMSELPEDNESSTISQRKACSDEIEELTDEMERLYPFYEEYTKQGIIPDNTILNSKNDDSLKTDKLPVGLDSLSKDELKKLRKSVATKLSRANNMLNYQTETKGKELNPMPESPKRVKYETKVHHLTEELKNIDYQIAKMG